MIAVGILPLLGSIPVAVVFAAATLVCLIKRRYAEAAFFFLPALCSLSLILLRVLSFTREVLPDGSGVDDTKRNSPVSTQDLVGTWGKGREAVTFHDDGTARAADGTRWRWKQSARNAFVMSRADAAGVPDRCWLSLRDDEEILLLPVDGCFDEDRGWSPGEALRRSE